MPPHYALPPPATPMATAVPAPAAATATATAGTILEVPNKDYSILGSILGSL